MCNFPRGAKFLLKISSLNNKYPTNKILIILGAAFNDNALLGEGFDQDIIEITELPETGIDHDVVHISLIFGSKGDTRCQ